jgi:hypothetical protein
MYTTLTATITSVPMRESASTLAPNKSQSTPAHVPPGAIRSSTVQRAAGDATTSAADDVMGKSYKYAFEHSLQHYNIFVDIMNSGGSVDCDEVEVHSILIIDANTFEVQHSHELGL